jgi:uncharacterized protein (TIGR02145 family)/uncharacterized repeat protein (TIGR02543 family)
MKTFKISFIIAVLLTISATTALTAQVTIGSEDAPQSFSILELVSNNRGLRLPQLTTTERDAISTAHGTESEMRGLQIFNTDSNCMEYWNGEQWISTCNNKKPSLCELQGGVLIGGCCWAKTNVDAPGTFAANPEDAGKFYKFNALEGKSFGDATPWTNVGYDNWDISKEPCPTGWNTPKHNELLSLVLSGSKWTTHNGVEGRRFGIPPDTIFLPAAGSFTSDYGGWNNVSSPSDIRFRMTTGTKNGMYLSSSKDNIDIGFLGFGDYDNWWAAPKNGFESSYASQWWLTTFRQNERNKYAMNIRCVHNDGPYTITYDAAGGTPALQIVNSTNDGRLVACPITPTRPGYIFAGWDYISSTAYDYAGAPIMGNLILTAKWSAIP